MRRAHNPIPALCWLAAVVVTGGAVAAADEPPPGVEQLLPRGRIAAVFEPQFVPAAEAELPDDAWVLGVVIEGRAKAYSLNLLNRHEVVNDRSGKTAYAAVWWPLANTAVVYGREIGERELNFEASGALWNASLVMRDRETDSWWSIMTSRAIGGALDGADLVELPVGEKTTWGEWQERHPESLVLSVGGSQHIDHNPYDDYLANDRTFRDLEIGDRRLAPKTPIFAFFAGGRPHAVPHAAIDGRRLLELAAGDRLLVFREPGAGLFDSTRAWRVPAGAPSAVERLPADGELEAAGFLPLGGIDTFWYNWISVNVGSEILR